MPRQRAQLEPFSTWLGQGTGADDQRLEAVYLTDRLDDYYRRRDVGHPTDIDPVIASEVLAALDRLTAKE